MTDRRIVVCTANEHKVSELAQLMPDFVLEPLPAGAELPPEIGTTFLDNARIKATAGAALTNHSRAVVADDSGLEVDALGGAPGVRSARFAGEKASDSDNIHLLLERLASVPEGERTARFRCVLVHLDTDGTETVADGTVEGRIAMEARGTNGFGYDPVFIPAGHDRTFGELSAADKATLSHRADAARALHDRLLAHA